MNKFHQSFSSNDIDNFTRRGVASLKRVEEGGSIYSRDFEADVGQVWEAAPFTVRSTLDFLIKSNQ
jgi:hypothetical protein